MYLIFWLQQKVVQPLDIPVPGSVRGQLADPLPEKWVALVLIIGAAVPIKADRIEGVPLGRRHGR